MRVKRCLAVLPLSLFAACTGQISSRAPATADLDSVVLERTPCFGTCPAYRLTLARSGVLHFLSKNPEESGNGASDTLPPALLDTITARAERIEFFGLPDTIQNDRSMCRDYATDHPTIIVGLFGKNSKEVVYDTGCYTGEGEDAFVDWHPHEEL